MKHLLHSLLLLALAASAGAAQKSGSERVQAGLVADTTAVEPGKPFRIGIRLVMDPGWHTYWKDPGDAGLATAVEWTLPAGFQAGELQWPAPIRLIEPGGIQANAYEGETLLTAVITPPAHIDSKNVVISAKVDWLVCEKVCLPGKAVINLELPVGGGHPANLELFERHPPGGEPIPAGGHPPADAAPRAASVPAPEHSLPVVLLFAVLGGLVLNVMPCVLPVISLKIFGFVSEAHHEPKKIFRLGLVFAAGIFFSFWVLASVVVALKSAGHEIGWGFQLQSPAFDIAMASVVLVFGLSLFGVFEFYLPTAVAGKTGELAGRGGYGGAFLNGLLATALATPCTAPVLGTAIAYAFSRSALDIFLVFTAVAFGLALPYLALTAQPDWMKRLPRPGPWMEKAKQFMGFLLIATVLWLLWVLGSLLGHKAAIWAGAFLLALSLACWVLGSFAGPASAAGRKRLAWIVAAAIAVGGGLLFLPRALGPEKSGIAWEPYSAARLEERLAEGRTVLLDFTAEWCLTCKVNESTVLDTAAVRDAIRRHNVATLKADWTHGDADITRLLQSFGRSGVPLYVVYPGRDPAHPLVLPEVITRQIVIDALDQAAGAGSEPAH